MVNINITNTKSCPYISPPKSAYERIQNQGLYSEVYGMSPAERTAFKQKAQSSNYRKASWEGFFNVCDHIWNLVHQIGGKMIL